MIETIAMVIVIMTLCSLIGWLDFNNRKERSKFINALMAKTPEQLRDLEFVERIQPVKTDTTPPDLIPVDGLDDEQFDKFIKEQVENG